MTVTWQRPAKRTFGLIDALSIGGLAALLVARFIPIARLWPFWGCPLRKATGFPCLSCGMTRAFDRVTHFHFAWAFDANPLGASGAIFLALLVPFAFVTYAFRMPRPEFTFSEREGYFARWAIFVTVAANYGWVIVRTLSA